MVRTTCRFSTKYKSTGGALQNDQSTSKYSAVFPISYIESRFGEEKSQGDHEWIIHRLPYHRGQPTMHLGGAARGDVADPEWFTHDPCA